MKNLKFLPLLIISLLIFSCTEIENNNPDQIDQSELTQFLVDSEGFKEYLELLQNEEIDINSLDQIIEKLDNQIKESGYEDYILNEENSIEEIFDAITILSPTDPNHIELRHDCCTLARGKLQRCIRGVQFKYGIKFSGTTIIGIVALLVTAGPSSGTSTIPIIKQWLLTQGILAVDLAADLLNCSDMYAQNVENCPCPCDPV